MKGRCRLCRAPLPGDGFCIDFVACNFRCRIRLGMPEWQVRMERGRDQITYPRRHGGRA